MFDRRFLGACCRLMRFDRPVGTWLVMWPVLWAWAWAFDAGSSLGLFLVYVVGVVVMRALGCVWNDYLDRDIDGQVARTRDRPLPAGDLSPRQAQAVLAVLALMALGLWLCLDSGARLWALGAAGWACLYPCAKRFFPCPQAVLGIAFAWSIPMVFVSLSGEVPPAAWWLFAGVMCWVIGYDTLYALVDLEDDKHLGIHTSALWWGRHAVVGVAVCYVLAVCCWLWAAYLAQLSWWPMGSLSMACGLGVQVAWAMRPQRQWCFRGFMMNRWLGLLFFLAILLGR